jgi:hypothetical protein
MGFCTLEGGGILFVFIAGLDVGYTKMDGWKGGNKWSLRFSGWGFFLYSEGREL